MICIKMGYSNLHIHYSHVVLEFVAISQTKGQPTIVKVP